MKSSWTTTLDPGSPRYAEWREILGGDDVPLVMPISDTVMLGGEKAEVYLLNYCGMSAPQRRRLVDWVSRKFSMTPEAAEKEIDEVGFPIRKADVIVTFHAKTFDAFL